MSGRVGQVVALAPARFSKGDPLTRLPMQDPVWASRSHAAHGRDSGRLVEEQDRPVVARSDRTLQAVACLQTYFCA